MAQYDALLKEIREVSRQSRETALQNEESAKQFQALSAELTDKLENTDKVNQLIDEGLEKIREIQQNGQDMAELETKLETLLTELTDHVHKENVKVYRNVQAVVEEETAKAGENVTGKLKSLSGKTGAVLGISIAALSLSAISVAFQLLVYFHIL